MKQTKAQLIAEIAALTAQNKTLADRAIKVTRWILAERARQIVGKTNEDHKREVNSPLPVTLWAFAQELAGDMPARQMAHDIDNAQRKKLGMAERPATDDPWLSRRLC